MVRPFSIDRQGEIVFVDKGAMYGGERGEGKERAAVGRVTDRVVVLVAPIVRVPKTRLSPFHSLSLSPFTVQTKMEKGATKLPMDSDSGVF